MPHSGSDSTYPSVQICGTTSFTIVQDNDQLGVISFGGADGTDIAEGVRITAEVDGTPGANQMPSALVISTSPAGSQTPTEALRIDSSQDIQVPNGSVFIGDTANANMTVGLIINQGANDDQAFALKSSDVAHGMTSAGGASETDDYFLIRKNSGGGGGVDIRAYMEDTAITPTLKFQAYGGTATTAKTTAGLGLIDFSASEHDGADALANITADGNVFSVRARVGGSVVTRFLIDEDGDMYSVTAGQTFDDFDDSALLDTYDLYRSGSLKGKIKADFGRVMHMDESTLIDAGILGGTMEEGGLTNFSQLSRVLVGGHRQLNQKHMSLVERVESLTLELETTNKQLAALTTPDDHQEATCHQLRTQLPQLN